MKRRSEMISYIVHIALALMTTGILVGMVGVDICKLWTGGSECLLSEPDISFVEGSDIYELDRYFRSICK